MRYGEGLLDEISRRTDIVQLVGRRIKLERKGRVFWGLCPFHKEKSPSFKVENERRTYHCFGCGAGGDVFKWLTET
ncbi:MAG TPA: CHC2 zinc finger domain-containing protein, partial [Micropepsaceae bacterium]|nr:CHC2 zinc finger domain-containing protein [Micropepsaceae bacterium]